jgi:hypothetical protein
MIMAAPQDKIQQNVERREQEVSANNIRSLAPDSILFRSNPIWAEHGDNFVWWQLRPWVKPSSTVFISLTEIDPISHEPKSDGTVKFRLSSISPKLDYLDLKFEAYNGAPVWIRVDGLIYT